MLCSDFLAQRSPCRQAQLHAHGKGRYDNTAHSGLLSGMWVQGILDRGLVQAPAPDACMRAPVLTMEQLVTWNPAMPDVLWKPSKMDDIRG